MKKIFYVLIIFFTSINFLYAETLLKDCKNIKTDGSFEEIETSDGARNQYLINFDTTSIVHTFVSSKSWFETRKLMDEIAIEEGNFDFPSAVRSWNIKYDIVFNDSKQVSAKTKVGIQQIAENIYSEIFVDLDKKIVMQNYVGVNETGKKVVDVMRKAQKHWGLTSSYQCE